MRLYLAVAVLMLAFVAYTEAQDADSGFANFQDRLSEFGRNVAEKAKDTIDTIKNSEVAQKTQNWFEEKFAKLKTHFQQD
ncbi:apolipoprotein C-I [Kryptolebias marmoratus]|uniref:Apolipoprotein C1 n=1 Tax=Kryptolebias marmoratus TaxID=37003 RepID=A0A3Q3AYU5_KRYMA|nr:apolipoprotein C-I [Kryptolebias marmoratus]